MSIVPPPLQPDATSIPPAATFNDLTPETQVTKINIDRCEAILRKEGFLGGKHPDELSPWYEMYMQVLSLREQEKKGERAGQSHRAIIDGRPGPIMSQPRIEFHSVNGLDMYRGRKAENGKSFIPGFFACAGALSKAQALSNRGNPWADFQLLMAYAFMQKFERELVAKMRELDVLRVERMTMVCREIEWTPPRPEEIARPHDPIFISTQYANLLLDILVLSDRCTIRYRHAQLNNLIPSKETIHQEIQILMKRWRAISYFIWSGTRLFLEREQIVGATRQNSTNAVPDDLMGFAKQHFRLTGTGMLEPIWSGMKMPPHIGR